MGNKNWLFFCLVNFYIALNTDPVLAEKQRWMEDLYGGRCAVKLRDIAIPGTHNAATYRISARSPLAPGERGVYRLAKPVVASWAKTQFDSLYEQLRKGIRFFDLRVAPHEGKAQIVHGLVSVPLTAALDDIARFARQQPKEVILIKYKLSEAFTSSCSSGEERQQAQLYIDQQFQQYLGSHLLGFSPELNFCHAWQSQRSVVLLDSYQVHWPNTHAPLDLHRRLQQALKSRNRNQFHEIQLIFTPPVDLRVLLNPVYLMAQGHNRNSLSEFSFPIRKQGLTWLRQWAEDGEALNIVSTDFATEFAFVDTLLAINARK